MKEKIPNAKFVIGLSTPALKKEVSAETHETPITLDGDRSDRTLTQDMVESNRIAAEIAKRFGYPVFDAYSLVVDRPELKVADGVHFTEEGKKLLASALLPYLL